MFGRSRRAANAQPVRRTLFVGDPAAARRQFALDAAGGRGMDSRGAGLIHANGKDSSSRKFSGELGPLQPFARVTPTRSYLRTENKGLPGTRPMPAQPNAVLATMSRMVP